MPKREPTPPLEDDYKYLIINYPFPLHANMSIPSESHDLAHWIASCIGQNDLNAIYHKPSAPNMVIIEVIKHCPRINALLGAHKWCEFLRRPEPDQVDKESRIYYCRHSSGREVQKHGWKRLDVWDHWFDNFDPVRGPFVSNPYPKASFCEVPPETQTDYGLCRPLPTDVFPRPRPTVKQNIVPGSDVYVNRKKTGAQPIASPVPSKQPVKSWASVTSSATPRKTDVEWPRATSRASSEGSSSIISPPIDVNIVSPPPGLGPPPGLSINSSKASSEWDFEPSPALMTPSNSTDWASSMEIITTGLAAAAIEEQQNPYSDEKDEGQYWAEQPARPTDWDKPICPVHKVACRAGICKVMDKIERDKKREAQRNGNGSGNGGDGWTQAKTRGRGRGRGQGRGRGGYARGNGTKNGGRGGGWC